MRKLSLLLLFLIWTSLVHAQDFAVDPNANITWPPPVLVVRGEARLYGTANIPNFSSYFIEYRRLNDDLTVDEDGAWLPATLPSATRVTGDVLGVWDTTRIDDGPYEIRMTINVTQGSPVYVVVSPLRVENTPSPFIPNPTATPEPAPLPTNTPPPAPTIQPTPTAFDLTPRVESATNANVRSGDSTAYPVVGALQTGETAPIRAISSTGSGWFQIELPNGGRGWISPVVVRVQGDVRDLPRIAPPPPPPPTATPTPVTQANLVVQFINLAPDPPRCNETFTITARVANIGTGDSTSGGALNVQDVHIATGNASGSTQGVFPQLAPGQTFDSTMRLTVDTYFEEGHRLSVTVDSAGQVAETNEGDNTLTREYTLRRGNCG